MSQKLYEVPAEWKRRAFIDAAKYRDMYARSIQDPDGFWGEIGYRIERSLRLQDRVRRLDTTIHTAAAAETKSNPVERQVNLLKAAFERDRA